MADDDSSPWDPTLSNLQLFSTRSHYYRGMYLLRVVNAARFYSPTESVGKAARIDQNQMGKLITKTYRGSNDSESKVTEGLTVWDPRGTNRRQP